MHPWTCCSGVLFYAVLVVMDELLYLAKKQNKPCFSVFSTLRERTQQFRLPTSEESGTRQMCTIITPRGAVVHRLTCLVCLSSVCVEDLRSPALHLLLKSSSPCEGVLEDSLAAGSWSESRTWCRTHPAAMLETLFPSCCRVRWSGDLKKERKKKEDALQSVKLAGYRAGSVCCFCIKMTKNYNHENILDRLSLKNQYDKLNLWFSLTFRGSTVVMMVASIKGLGLCAVSSMSDCHCRGSPTNFCSCSSKSVCTRCSKLDGAEIWIRDFFFLANMMAAVAEHQTCVEEGGKGWRLTESNSKEKMQM